VPRSANKSRKLGSACAAGIAALAVAAWQLVRRPAPAPGLCRGSHRRGVSRPRGRNRALFAVDVALVARRRDPARSVADLDGLVLFGTQISNEVADLVGRLPFAWQTVEDRIGQGWLRAALQRVGNAVSTGGNIVEGPRARGSGPATGR